MTSFYNISISSIIEAIPNSSRISWARMVGRNFEEFLKFKNVQDFPNEQIQARWTAPDDKQEELAPEVVRDQTITRHEFQTLGRTGK